MKVLVRKVTVHLNFINISKVFHILNVVKANTCEVSLKVRCFSSDTLVLWVAVVSNEIFLKIDKLKQ